MNDFAVSFKELHKLYDRVVALSDLDAIQKAKLIVVELAKYEKLKGDANIIRQKIIIALMQKQISALTKQVLALSKP